MIGTSESSRVGGVATTPRDSSSDGASLGAPVAVVRLADGYHLLRQDRGCWRHALSPDLMRWRQLPLTGGSLRAESGAILLDGPDLVAFLIADDGAVRMARSTDAGLTWGHGLIVVPAAQLGTGARDPRVVRDDARDQWVMVVAEGDRLCFLVSTDLTSWTPTGTFGGPRWRDGGDLSHPDLFPLPLDGDIAWVLWWTSTAAPQTNGSATRYVIGDWDGEVFTPRTSPSPVLRTDMGRDLYAPISFLDAPSGRRIMVAAMGNEDYADRAPADESGPMLCTPREVALVRTPAGPRLTSQPIAEIADLHTTTLTTTGQPITAACNPLSGLGGRTLDADIELEASAYDTAGSVTLQVRCDSRVHTDIVWRPAEGSLTIDRGESGVTEFSQWFATPHPESGIPAEGLLRAQCSTVTARWPQSYLGVMRRAWLRVVVGPSSLEVFSPDGLVAITSAIFPGPGATGLRLTATSGTARLVRATVHPLPLH